MIVATKYCERCNRWFCQTHFGDPDWLEVSGNVPAYCGAFLLHYLDSVVYPDISPNLLIVGVVAVCILNLCIYIRRFRIRYSLG